MPAKRNSRIPARTAHGTDVRKILGTASAGLALASFLVWLVPGAHRGWTKTSVPIPHKDPVTDQDYVVWEKRFVPGVDLLAVGLGTALVLFVVSLFLSKPKTNSINSSSP